MIFKISVVVASRANYGRVKYLLLAIKSHPSLELDLILAGSALLDRFGDIRQTLVNDGFDVSSYIYYSLEGENLVTQAKSTGLGIIELATALSLSKPNAVLTVADRFETMATAIAASYMNIPLLHLQGGEVSGNIDNRVRDAISMLADYHFPCTKKSSDRLVSLGIDPSTIFCHGCPAMDVISNTSLSIDNSVYQHYLGAGTPIDFDRPYLLVLQHPVTTSFGKGFSQIQSTLKALLDFPDYQKLIMWPNIDAGSDDVAKGIRIFRESSADSSYYFHKNFTPENYIKVMANAKCLIGNSSSFIREGCFLGIPAVIIGDRQSGREVSDNVVFSDYDKLSISNAIRTQLVRSSYPHDNRYGSGNVSPKIAQDIHSIMLNI